MKFWHIIILSICLSWNDSLAQINYRVDSNIVIKNDSLQIGASLYYPKNIKPIAGLVIVSGTGKQNRKGNMAGHNIFEQLSVFLANNGIAVLTMDDRGTGWSTGDYDAATTLDFACDALKALQYLKNIPDINPKKIGLMGHSEGGMAIAIAAAQSKDVRFLISLAGLATNGFDALIRQNEDMVRSSPMSAGHKERFNQINRLMFETALAYADSTSLEAQLHEVYQVWKRKDDSLLVQNGIQLDRFRFPIYSYAKSAASPWYRYFIKYDASKVLRGIDLPVLAINGDQDLMVSAKQNLENWKRFINDGKNNRVTTHLFSKVNHLLLPCESCTMSEYHHINKTIDPELLAVIKKWIYKSIR